MNIDKDIKPEEALLLKLCRLRFDEKVKSEAEAICKEGINWEYFCQAANLHGVTAPGL